MFAICGLAFAKGRKEMSENYTKTIFVIAKNIIKDSKILTFYLLLIQNVGFNLQYDKIL